MSIKIMGMIGTSDYSVVSCEKDGEPLVEYYDDSNNKITGSKYSLITILHNLSKYEKEMTKGKNVELIIFHTPQSKEKHLSGDKDEPNNLYEQLLYHKKHKLLNFEYSIILVEVKNDSSLDSSWELFSEIGKHINDDDKLILDVTFGYRNQQIIMLLTLMFKDSSFQESIVERVFYVKDKDESKEELVDLTNMYLISKWSDAISTFINTGQYHNVDSLILKLNDKSEISNSILEVSKAIKSLANSLFYVKVGFYFNSLTGLDKILYKDFIAYNIYKLRYMIKNLFNNIDKSKLKHELGIIKIVLEKLYDKYSWMQVDHHLNNKEAIIKYLNENYYNHLFHILMYYNDCKMYQQALTFMKDVIGEPGEYDSNKNQYIAYNVKTNNVKDERKFKDLVNYYYIFYDNLAESVNKKIQDNDFNVFLIKFCSIIKNRNKVNHAYTIYKNYNHDELILHSNSIKQLEKNDNDYDNFIEKNKKHFKLYFGIINNAHFNAFYNRVDLDKIKRRRLSEKFNVR